MQAGDRELEVRAGTLTTRLGGDANHFCPHARLQPNHTKSYRRVKEDMLLYDHRTLQDDSAVGEHCMDIMGNPVYFIFIFTLIKE